MFFFFESARLRPEALIHFCLSFIDPFIEMLDVLLKHGNALFYCRIG